MDKIILAKYSQQAYIVKKNILRIAGALYKENISNQSFVLIGSVLDEIDIRMRFLCTQNITPYCEMNTSNAKNYVLLCSFILK